MTTLVSGIGRLEEIEIMEEENERLPLVLGINTIAFDNP